VADYLRREHPEVETIVIDAASTVSVEGTVHQVMQRIGVRATP